MNQLHKVIIDNKISPDWKKLPNDKRREYTVIKKGSGPPGLYSLRITKGSPIGFFNKSQVVQIHADTPEIGYIFVGWTGDISVVDNPNNPNTTVIIPGHDVELEATYELGEYTLVVNDGIGDGIYNYNDNVPIAADPPPTELITFDQWIGDIVGIVDIFAAATSIIMPPTNVVIQATYKDIYYDLVINNGGGDGTYLKNSIIEIVADPPLFGQTFNGWIGDIGTIDTPHLPIAYINMQGNYTITASYVNIEQIDPDANEGHFDVKLNINLDQYDNNYLGNTVINPNINRYYDVGDKSSTIRFNSILFGPNTPGGGLGLFSILPMDTDSILKTTPPNIIDGGDYPGSLIGPNTPGGGSTNDPSITPDQRTMFSLLLQLDTDHFKYPIDYTPYIGYKEIIADADTLVSSGFAGGEVTLAAMRDGNLGNTGVYTTTPVGDYIGVTFPETRTIGGFLWCSLHRGNRIADFELEYYNGSIWQKLPITDVGSSVSIINTDEGLASNSDGWKYCYFSPIEMDGIRLLVNGVWDGNVHCGVTELRVLESFVEEIIPPAPSYDYLVSGAGIATVNGEYSYAGEHNAHHYYKHATEEQYIFWNDEYGPGWWIATMLDGVGPASQYYTGDTPEFPPLTGWIVSVDGDPAPTLSTP